MRTTYRPQSLLPRFHVQVIAQKSQHVACNKLHTNHGITAPRSSITLVTPFHRCCLILFITQELISENQTSNTQQLMATVFTTRRYSKSSTCHRRVSVRPSVCLSVTLQYFIKTAKRRITQIMPHDST